MRPKFVFSSRHTGQARDPKNIGKEKKKFPDVFKGVVEKSDIILEVLDARFFHEMIDYEFEKELKEGGKKIIYVLNKRDLLAKKVKKSFLKKLGLFVFTSCKERKGLGILRDVIKRESKKIAKDRKILVGVVGYPNTGKSSLINLLIGRSSAGVGGLPGYTKGVQKLRLSKNIILLDSPGVIPIEEYSTSKQFKIVKHAKFGARHYSKVKNPEIIVAKLMEEYKTAFENYYNVGAKGDSELLMEEVGRKLNILKKGGDVDSDKVARRILKDFQEGKIRV